MAETRTLSLPVILPPDYEKCERCVSRLKDSLLQVHGVLSVEVDRQASTLKLVYDPHLARLEDVEHRAKRIGIELQERIEHASFELIGLDCPDCAIRLEKGVAQINGVLWASTSFASSRLAVEYEPDKVAPAAIARRVRELGYGVREPEAQPQFPGGLAKVELRRLPLSTHVVLTLLSGITLLVALLFSWADVSFVAKAFYVVSTLFGGYYAARGAIYSLCSFTLDMNFLMTAAAIGALAIGEWFEAAAVMFLFSLGNTLESRTVERARESIRSLMELHPTFANVIRDGKEEKVAVEEIRLGDTLVVRPGEKIPTDGTVIEGSSTVNQSPVTGESIPVEKTVGDRVFAGTINRQGSILIRAEATAQDNILARIIHLVEEAETEKAPSQRFTEAFGRYYTPVVVGLAVVIAVVPPLCFHANFRMWLYKALTLLVVSCPCALVISIPVTIVCAIGNAARNGVLIKGGAHLEKAGRIRVVAFDKTGTLTTGEAKVTDVVPVDGFTAEDVLSLAAGVEARSEHPLAQAIMKEARKRRLEPRNVTDFAALTGTGAAGKLNGDSCLVGNLKLMQDFHIELGVYYQKAKDLQEEGKTVVFVALNRRLVGLVALADAVRESAKQAFHDLREAGIERIVMITGDNETTARAVAREVRVDEYYAELLPEDKVDIVRLLIERYSSVGVVGDGVNDAPALASASVGIAMGVVGSPTALETADVALMSDDLGKLPYTMRLSRQSLKIIKQNIAFSLFVILVLVASALAGWLKLSMGVFGHEWSALVVIANGMRLLRFR